MSPSRFAHPLSAPLLALGLGLAASGVHAAGFQLIEQNAMPLPPTPPLLTA